MTAEEEFAAAEAEAEFNAAEQASEGEMPAQAADQPRGLPVDNLVTARTVEQQPLYVVPDSFSMGDEKQVVRQQENAALRFAFETAQHQPNDAAALSIAKKFNVRAEYVRANLPAWQQAAAKADFDPEAIDPALRRVMLRDPELAPTVLASKELNGLTKAFNAAMDWLKDAAVRKEFAPPDAYGATPDLPLLGIKGTPAPPSAAAALALQAKTPEDFAAKQASGEAYAAASRAKRDAPQQVAEVDDNKAAVLREGGGVANAGIVALARAREAQAQLEISKLSFRSMLEGLKGNDTTALDSQLHDAKLAARPRNYGEGPWGQAVTDAITGAVSSADVLGEVIKTGGVGATSGAVVGGIAGAVITKTPQGALAMATEGAGIGARAGGSIGAAEGSFVLEAGSSYQDLLELETDSGKRITKQEAAGGALIAGAAKAGLEVLQLRALAKTLGPLTALVEGGGMAEVKRLLATNPTFRRQAAAAALQYLKSTGEEALEEGSQEAVDQLVPYLVASKADRAFQARPIFNEQRLLEATGKGGLGALAMGGFGTAVSLGTAAIASDKNARDEAKVQALAALASDPAAQAAPEAIAAMVKEISDGNGEPVTAMHVDASAIVRFFQTKKDDGETANAEVERLLGPEGPKKLLEAAAAGGKVEVPMADYIAKWASSELGKATLADTTTDPAHLTPVELKARSAELEAEAQAIAEAEVKKLADEAKADELLNTLRDELVAAGRPKKEARAAAMLWKHFWRTQAADFHLGPEELFANLRVRFGLGDNTIAPAGALEQPSDVESELRARYDAQKLDTPEGLGQRQRDFFIDSTTGLLNARAWKRIEPTAKSVASISVEGVKYANDTQGGHQAGDAVYAAAAQALAPLLPGLAKVGGDFAVADISQEDLDAALELANANPVLQGFKLLGHVAENTRAASALHNATKAQLEADGKRAKRGEKPLGAPKGKLKLDAVPVEGRAIAKELLDAHAAADQAEAFREQYFEPGTGLLTKDGRDTYLKLHPQKFHVSIDLNLLKAFNKALGEAGGDVLLTEFGKGIADLGGAEFIATHVSGDEYSLNGNDEKTLKQFQALLAQWADGREIDVEVDGADEMVPGVSFGWGLAENIDAAEAALNADKERLATEGKRGRTLEESLAIVQAKIAEGRARRSAGRRQEGNDQGGSRPETSDVSGTVPEGRVDPQKLNQPGEDNAPPLGYVELPEPSAAEKIFKVFFNPAADASTVIHESAHVFLEMLGELAAKPNAPQRTKDTHAAALGALGVKPGEKLTTEQHETFARSFEAWLYEGNAPAAGLAKAFQFFKSWLMTLYRSIADLDVELNDDLRNVFARLLATDDEIRRQLAKRAPATEATTPEQQAEDLLDAHELTRKAELFALKDRLRTHEKWWKDGLAKLRQTFGEEYERLPARVAQRILQGEADDVVLASEPLVLDKAFVEAVLGERRAPGIRTAVDGVNPDEVAQLAGFKTGADMLRSVVDLPQRDTWVEKQAEEAMREAHLSVLEERTRLRELVADGLQTFSEKKILREWAELTAKAGGSPAPVEALKRAAAIMVERRKVGDLKPGRALQAERAAATAKARAAAKGDWTAALEAGRQQLLNAYLYSELRDAKKEREALEGLAGELRGNKARARLGKAMPVYRDAVDFVLGLVGLSEPTELEPEVLDQAVAQMNGDAVIVGDPEWLEPLKAVSGDLKTLTVAQMRVVGDALKQLRAAARHRTDVLLDDKAADKEETIAALVAEAEAALPKRKAPGTASANTVLEQLGGLYNLADGTLMSPTEMVRDLAGDDPGSTWWRALVLPFRRAKHREADLLKAAIKPITDAFDAIPKAVRARFAEAVDGKALFPGHTDAFQAPRRRFELFMLALNAGNESNLQRLTDGRNITVGEVRAALDLLTKEELDAVQAIFDAAESLRPEAFALEERVGGLAPKAIEATRMTLKGGTLRGGYFPAVYERAASVVGARQEASALAQLLDPSYSRPGTPHSHLKSRADRVEAVISLEPRTVGTHLAQVAHDIAFREAVMSIGSLVISPEIKKVLTERLGEAKEKQFLQWVKDVGSMRGTQPSSGKVLDFFRSKMPTALLGFSAPTALGDLANLAAAVTSTPLATKHLAAGLAEFAASPVESRRVALEKSGELRSMQDTIKRDFAKATKALVARGPLETGPLAWLKDNAFAFMEGINVATATPVWLGGYRQAIAEGKSEGEAVRFADDLLTRVFPSHSAVDQAAILRDKGWLGKSTVFYGYLSTAYNAFRGIARPLRSKAYAEGTPAFRAKAVAQVAGRGFAFAVAFSVLGELLMGRGPDDGDRDDDEPDDKALMWRNWFVRKLLIAGPSTVPFLSDVASAVETRWTGRPINTRASPVAGAVLEIGKATEKVLNGDATAADKVAAGLKAFGLTTGVPTKPITTTGRYLFDVAAGEREVDGWGQFVGGVIYGARDNQPINVFTAPNSLAN